MTWTGDSPSFRPATPADQPLFERMFSSACRELDRQPFALAALIEADGLHRMVLSRFYKAAAASGLTILSGERTPAGKETGHG
ncbi:MAG TPA: hypothetical protein VNO33_06860 [Kofleriaceae bacterium]|nr:hypothetical protein [Kofleriaceae bacterium]